MRTAPFSLEVLAVLFLALIPWPGPAVYRITCSRDNSKIVRKVIQTKWLPVLEKFQVRLPLECPFHPGRDMFSPQLAARRRHRPSQWTCAFCGKSFFEERHLDAHFDLRHKSLINKAEDAVCLAEYCDIMRCAVLARLGAGGAAPGTDVELWRDARRALAPAAPRDLARVPPARRAAAAPPKLGCPKTDSGAEGDKREESEGEANQTAECDDTVEAARPAGAAGAAGAAGGPAGAWDPRAERAACDPAQLQRLKARCETVVHSCIAVLLLQLTQRQFVELEEEMQRAVCWYLSCDRYWEEAAPSARAFPWPLLLALATGLALALCMCYYIVWILFDSEEGSVAGSATASLTSHSTPARALDDDDQYLYVTYPPDLKRRLLERYRRRQAASVLSTPVGTHGDPTL